MYSAQQLPQETWKPSCRNTAASTIQFEESGWKARACWRQQLAQVSNWPEAELPTPAAERWGPGGQAASWTGARRMPVVQPRVASRHRSCSCPSVWHFSDHARCAGSGHGLLSTRKTRASPVESKQGDYRTGAQHIRVGWKNYVLKKRLGGDPSSVFNYLMGLQRWSLLFLELHSDRTGSSKNKSLPRKALEPPFSKTSTNEQERLSAASSKLPLFWAEGWTTGSLQVPSIPNHSVLLILHEDHMARHLH